MLHRIAKTSIRYRALFWKPGAACLSRDDAGIVRAHGRPQIHPIKRGKVEDWSYRGLDDKFVGV